ncbi:MAG: apolipoprotein N-acyltransferase, partial [Rickettsiales bacterium]|nr:apolipoprotein N-acyltransferase [Rickettsiales bacterium]
MKNRYTKLFFIGLSSSLAFAPLYLFFIFFYSFHHLLSEIEENGYKSVFLKGWMFGFGYFIGNCYWYCNSLLIEPLKFGWLVPFALSIIPAYLAIYTGLTTLAVQICKKYVKNRFVVVVAFATFWTFFEYLRGIMLTGFPWNIICYSLSFSPLLIQTVSIYGCYVFGFILVILYSAPYVLVDKKYNRYAFLYAFLVLFIIIYGFYNLNRPDNEQPGGFTVRLVQPNLSQREKISTDSDTILTKMIELSMKNSENIKYIIWAESALPHYILYNEENEILDVIGKEFGDKILITGAIRVDRNKGKIFNSIIVIKNGKIIDYYDKYHLVPFGEFIPFANIFPIIGTITGMMSLSRAENRQKIIKINDTFPLFSPNICYESIFSDSVNKNADLIINLTNDAWFGNTSGPY